jgi:hypothetical protein
VEPEITLIGKVFESTDQAGSMLVLTQDNLRFTSVE